MWSLPVQILALGSLAVLTLAVLACGGDKEPADACASASGRAYRCGAIEPDRHSNALASFRDRGDGIGHRSR